MFKGLKMQNFDYRCLKITIFQFFTEISLLLLVR